MKLISKNRVATMNDLERFTELSELSAMQIHHAFIKIEECLFIFCSFRGETCLSKKLHLINKNNVSFIFVR